MKYPNFRFSLFHHSFIMAEAIPRLVVAPRDNILDLQHNLDGKSFLLIAGVGLGVNTFGTLVFMFAGNSAHGHSHGGGKKGPSM